jgi:hypothetical protein
MEDPMAENLRQGMDAVAGKRSLWVLSMLLWLERCNVNVLAESFDALYTLLNYAREENQQRQAEEVRQDESNLV